MRKAPSLRKAKALYLKARQAYYLNADGSSIITDAEFDALEQMIEANDPDWHVLKTTGAVKKSDVELPEFAPSLSKIYNWPGQQSNKGYVITPKLDGSAVLVTYKKGKPHALYSRGNGTVGGDISFLLPFISLPKKIAHTRTITFRMEAVMRDDVFRKRWQGSLEEGKFASARAAVNGQLNRTLAEVNVRVLADTDFIVVGVYDEPVATMFSKARKLGFKTVPVLPYDKLSHEVLAKILKEAKKYAPYAVDGLVLTVKTATFQYADANLPAFTVAFKQNAEGSLTKVVDVAWQISRFGRWTPVYLVDPVDFDGVTVSRATAHNAAMMTNLGVGIGSVVSLVRSGEVIPYVTKVIKKGKFVAPPGEYGIKGVHFYATGKELQKVSELRMLNFLRGLGVKHLAIKGIHALHNAGCDSLLKLLSAAQSPKGRQRIKEVLGEASGATIIKQLVPFLNKGIELSKFAAYSGTFDEGVGHRRIVSIGEEMPLSSLLTMSKKKLFSKLLGIRGIGVTLAQIIAEGSDELREVAAEYEEAGIRIYVAKKKKAVVGSLTGCVFAFTGYRSEEQKAKLEALGATVAPSITKATTHLLYNPQGKFLDKVKRAAESGIKTLTWQELKI